MRLDVPVRNKMTVSIVRNDFSQTELLFGGLLIYLRSVLCMALIPHIIWPQMKGLLMNIELGKIWWEEIRSSCYSYIFVKAE
jgi:hypothetical protein